MNVTDKQKQYAKRYRAPFIEPGIISYEDLDAGTILVPRSALDRMRDTFIGKPVVNEDHVDLDPEEAFRIDNESNPQAKGIVIGVGTTNDGWDYADLLVWDRETQKNIDEKGYTVSCAYTPTQVDSSPGMWHNISYDEKLIDGEYTHMAIVSNPRYEDVTIYPNSKDKKMKFKFLKNKSEVDSSAKKKSKKNMADEEKEIPEEMEMESAVIEVNGEMIPIEEAIAAYKMQKENEVVPMSPEDTIEIDGETVTVADLIKAVQAGKENVGDPKEIEAETVVDEEMQKKNQKQNQKQTTQEKPNKNFILLKNKSESTEQYKPNISTKAERIKNGKLRYGSAVKPKEVSA